MLAALSSASIGFYRQHSDAGSGGGNSPQHDDSKSLFATMHIDDLLRKAVESGASDLHFRAGKVPALRIQGRLRPLHPIAEGLALAKDPGFESKGDERVPPSIAQRIIYEILSDEAIRKFETELSVDISYKLPHSPHRFRVNVSRNQNGVNAVFRTIPEKVPSMDDLKLPAVLKQILSIPNGLVLVTGPTGSGKSTTLAAVVNEINLRLDRNVISLEEPIEYVHTDIKSIISQREVPTHTRTFQEGIRAALRQDPDIILLGEMRDLETTQTALTAAETGHLVLATLHTNNAAETLHRMVEQFDEGQQDQIRAQLSQALKMVVAQSLVPTIDGKRVAVFEVMICTPAIKNLIRTNKTEQILSTIQTSGKLGMMTKESQLEELVRHGIVALEVAALFATEPEELKRRVQSPTAASLSKGK